MFRRESTPGRAVVGTCWGRDSWSGRREEDLVPFKCCGEGRGQTWCPRAPRDGTGAVHRGVPVKPPLGWSTKVKYLRLGLCWVLVGWELRSGEKWLSPERAVPCCKHLGATFCPPGRVGAVARVGAETVGCPSPRWLRESGQAEGAGCQASARARSFPAAHRRPLQSEMRACCERGAPLCPPTSHPWLSLSLQLSSSPGSSVSHPLCDPKGAEGSSAAGTGGRPGLMGV